MDDPFSSEWKVEIVEGAFGFGVSFEPKSEIQLIPRHADFRYFLSKESFSAAGDLQKIVIFPGEVAAFARSRGFELVVVRDWIMSSTLAVNNEQKVRYLKANSWEVANNNALTQMDLIQNSQLAFSGTHDLVDHLLDMDLDALKQSDDLFQKVGQCFKLCFSGKSNSDSSNEQLHLSYLIGVMLDDLVQPKWYGSTRHRLGNAGLQYKNALGFAWD